MKPLGIVGFALLGASHALEAAHGPVHVPDCPLGMGAVEESENIGIDLPAERPVAHAQKILLEAHAQAINRKQGPGNAGR